MQDQQDLIDSAVAWAYGEVSRPPRLQELFEALVSDNDFELCYTLVDLDLCSSSASDLLETPSGELTSADMVIYAQKRIQWFDGDSEGLPADAGSIILRNVIPDTA